MSASSCLDSGRSALVGPRTTGVARVDHSSDVEGSAPSAPLEDAPISAERLLQSLSPELHERLRALGATSLRRLGGRAPVQATDLVHDAYVKVCRARRLPPNCSLQHLFQILAKAMTEALTDALRRVRVHRSAVEQIARRGCPPHADCETRALERLTRRLAERDPVAATVVRLRLAGLDRDTIGLVVGLSGRRVAAIHARAKRVLSRLSRADAAT